VLCWATNNLRLTRFTTAWTWGSHHLPPYSIFCIFPWGPHSNNILSQDSHNWDFCNLGGRITLCANLQLQWGLKQSCSPSRKFSNDMSHVTWTFENQVDSWLLVVQNQIVNLTFDLSFGHNLCFKCPNESYEPISDIYISIVFWWYKKLFELMGFDPYNHALKSWESIWDSNSHNGSSFESARVHSLTFLALPRACEVTPGPSSWPATLHPPCLGHEPKARVVTTN
jgi:hypothetical protein